MNDKWLEDNEWYAGLNEMKSRLRAMIVAFETNPDEGDAYPVLTEIIQGHRVTMQAERFDSSDTKTSFNYQFIVEPTVDLAKDATPEDPLFVPDDRDGVVKGLWMMDAGCGHDLVPKRATRGCHVEMLDEDHSAHFQTANGDVTTDECAWLWCEELGQRIKPFILNQTPRVLSIGKRCMEMGYSFIWKAGEEPILYTPSKKVVPLRVVQNIPYLDAGDGESNPRNQGTWNASQLQRSWEE